MIEVKNIGKSFGELEVLKGVNLSVKKGEIVAIIGKSGAGKTTLLQIIGTLDRPTGQADQRTSADRWYRRVCDEGQRLGGFP